MKLIKNGLMLVGVLALVVTLAAPALARYVPPSGNTTYTDTALPATTPTTPTPSTTEATTTEAAATTTITPPAPAPSPTNLVSDLAAQINSLLKQLIALLTNQLEGLKQQLASKQETTPPATPPAAPATTTEATAPTVAVNKPPRVNITYPYGGLDLTDSGSVEVIASAFDEDGSISKVEFFANNASIGTYTGSNGPWSVRWSPSVAGDHSLTAKATDDKGAVTTSGPISLIVKSAAKAGEGAPGFQDIPPTVTITHAVFTGTNLAATATASTYAGSITNVVWSRAASTTSDAAYVTDTTSPYNGAIVGAAIGTHTISAIATNSQGLTTRTASTTVTTN